MSYSTDPTEGWRNAGSYAGKILKGARPGDLPILQASKFVLVINQKTAKLLSVAVPPSLLALADEVVEYKLGLGFHVQQSFNQTGYASLRNAVGLRAQQTCRST
ncbi:ABC transporter substrate binding protein [Bradyrhizobium sp. MOS002]|uniref:ABC transporter substrate binding protein n=1 Tax=Bradyrhizobium sp. MOS002 TaxID=2133947 RepID=UPI0026C7A4BB|nr:ABC transporter substrate binding protein [Bradyrhizobium sp. MOS002]